MSTLTNNQYIDAERGDYHVITVIGTGTAKLQISVDDGVTYTDITNASWSATATAIVTVPDGRVRAVLTGDATMDIDPVGE